MIAQQFVNGLVLGSIYALAALGFTIIYGVARLVNFAYGELLMVGAFTTLTLRGVLGIDFFTAVLLAMALVAALSVVLYGVAIRPTLAGGDHLRPLLVTTGLLYVLREVAIDIWGTAPQQLPMDVEGVLELSDDVIVTWQRVLVVVVTVVIILLLHQLLYRTRIGKALRAVAQDRTGAVAIGLDVNRIVAITFGLSGALACVAGALLGSLYAVEPQMGAAPLLRSFAIVILGGLGSLPGAIVGALIVGMIETFSGAYISFAFKDVFMFLAVMLVLIWRPTGLMGRASP